MCQEGVKTYVPKAQLVFLTMALPCICQHLSVFCSVFSTDGSDWHQTDIEDQRINRSQSRGGERAEPSQLSQNPKLGKGNSGNPTYKSAGHELSPIYIIKNMVLKKVRQMYGQCG